MKNNFKGIALFAGCGGFSLGMKNAGIEVVGMVEIEKAAREIYLANNPTTEILGTDITQITEQEIKQWKAKFGEIDILFGVPPCQGFSLAGKRDENDPRNTLFLNFAKIAKILQPKVVVLENVRVLTSMKFSDNSLVIDALLKSFEEAGYLIDYKELNAQNYGVPQFRERVFFIGVRKDLGIKPNFPVATHSNYIQSDLLFVITFKVIYFLALLYKNYVLLEMFVGS